MNTNSIDNVIDEIIRDNKIFRFASELQNTNTNNVERKQDIQNILRNLERSNVEEQHCARDKLDNIYSKIDTCALKKKWCRLQVTQKKERIKKYLNDNITDIEQRNKFEKILVEKLEQGYLKTIKDIDYDVELGIIKNISILIFEPMTKQYSIIEKKLKKSKKEKVEEKVEESESD